MDGAGLSVEMKSVVGRPVRGSQLGQRYYGTDKEELESNLPTSSSVARKGNTGSLSEEAIPVLRRWLIDGTDTTPTPPTPTMP